MIPNFKGKKILCIGDVMLDRYVYGQVERISPEAPVPVLHAERQETLLGGAGTVLRNISALGGEAVFISIIGGDNEGHNLTRLIGQVPNIIPYLITDPDRITTVKIRHVSGTHQVARVDYETTDFISQKIEEIILERVKANLNCDAITLSDYGKGIFTRSLIKEIVRLAKRENIPIIVDPKSHDFTIYQDVTVLTPNLPELFKAALFSTDVPENMKHSKDVEAIAKLLMKHTENILVTRGKDGMTCFTKNGVKHIPAQTKKVYDVTGAGDTVVAVLALGLACDLTLPEAAYVANAAAGIVVGKVGTATVSPEELQEALCVKLSS